MSNQMVKEILEKRYFLKDDNGNVIEDWYKLCDRVASVLSLDSNEYENFYNVMKNCDFLPNSPTLMNAGNGNKFTLSACFVLPLEDSMESIYDAVKSAALINKMGGGTGFDFSVLRPADSEVGTTQGVASGPLSFIEVFNKSTDTIKQGGKRRGANMGILRIDHPDIEQFIDAKIEDGKFSNFNFSIGITNEFMRCVEGDTDFDLVFNGKTYKTVSARYLWDKIIKNAHNNGEPGVVFLDSINKNNPLIDKLGPISATNPCGEQPLYPNEACVLGSINLSNMLKGDNWVTSEPCNLLRDFWKKIDYDKLKNSVEVGVTMLDNIIDIQGYPDKDFEAMCKANRKIGIGVMGFADLLIKCKVKYGSDLSIEIANSIMDEIKYFAHGYSQEFISADRCVPDNLVKTNIMRRNATVTTIAPTGTLSLIANCSSGIEPNFSYVTNHNRIDNEFITYHPLAEEYKTHCVKSNIDTDLPDYFITSSEIIPSKHIEMQAAFQRHIDNAVSKTINMSSDATIEDVINAYNLSYKLGCKGVTVYRDGSRGNQVLSNESKSNNTQVNKIDHLPDVLNSKRIRINTPEGKVYINISYVNNTAKEVYISHPADLEITKTEMYESIARIISIALRHDAPVQEIIKQLNKSNKKYGSLNSVTNAISKALVMFNNSFESCQKHVESCPECCNDLVLESGCKTCKTCGYSACS